MASDENQTPVLEDSRIEQIQARGRAAAAGYCDINRHDGADGPYYEIVTDEAGASLFTHAGTDIDYLVGVIRDLGARLAGAEATTAAGQVVVFAARAHLAAEAIPVAGLDLPGRASASGLVMATGVALTAAINEIG